MGNFNETEWHYKRTIEASLYIVLSLYVKHEARISFYDDENFGDTANIICSLNRAIEHLLKLKLIKTDLRKLYKTPQNLIDYCILNKKAYPCELKNFYHEHKNKDLEKNRLKQEKILFSRTIDFQESIKRVKEILPNSSYNFKNFIDIHNLRNYLEHNWNGKEEEFLRKIIKVMVYDALPTIKEYITKILEEDYKQYFDKNLLKEIEILNTAIQNKHSIALHKRFTELKKIYEENPEQCCEEYSYPDRYNNLFKIETNINCPICKSEFVALFDLEADFDYADGESYVSGVYEDIKCLHCNKCCFYVDDIDIGTYVPETFRIDLAEYFHEDYEEDYY